jgi:glycosyltransferase involved in cell wall biosynthesis
VREKIHFISNGIFSTRIAGGDIHSLNLAEAAARAGYELNFFGGHALAEVIAQHKLPGSVTLTDEVQMGKVNQGALSGQIAMFHDFYRRYRRTRQLLHLIAPDDFVYAVSDYWFDVLPTVYSPARRKLMVLHMEAPNLGQIITRRRPDVDRLRLASLHYWASQAWSLHRFARCPTKRLFHLHPLMTTRLRKLGMRDEEMILTSYGLDVAATETVPAQTRLYDVVWIGRVHRQKGIDDLLATLAQLARRLDNLRAVFIGNVKDELWSSVKKFRLENIVEFSGFVTETEKIRLFKASRVFLMPSRHEGSPRVIGESIIAGTPVVAYDVPNYRPLFGDFVRYAPPFNLEAFQQTAAREIQEMRAGKNYLDARNLADFKRENSWETTQAKFVRTLEAL